MLPTSVLTAEVKCKYLLTSRGEMGESCVRERALEAGHEGTTRGLSVGLMVGLPGRARRPGGGRNKFNQRVSVMVHGVTSRAAAAESGVSHLTHLYGGGRLIKARASACSGCPRSSTGHPTGTNQKLLEEVRRPRSTSIPAVGWLRGEPPDRAGAKAGSSSQRLV